MLIYEVIMESGGTMNLAITIWEEKKDEKNICFREHWYIYASKKSYINSDCGCYWGVGILWNC